ncbi:uncharacterized protein C17orf98 homolog [Apteryx rowi]|uniref:uncharacterized protein C17orf98 homolog n=1 Tax=Apteryx rowi TaxID=308060 RepID=UPI000E1D64DB|nr:uncharacterized protein C17orf98 homolog [Apteryx rowi]
MDKRIRALQWTVHCSCPQHHGGTSREGWILDVSIPMEQNRCSNRRNWAGAGHFIEQVSDRGFFLADLKPLKGYNGRFGYCHNTPNLWLKSSSFGEVTIFPIHG